MKNWFQSLPFKFNLYRYGVAVKGLEEVMVHTPAEIFNYLSQVGL